MKDNKKNIIKVIIFAIFVIIIIYIANKYFRNLIIVKRILRVRVRRPDAHKFKYIMTHHKSFVAVIFVIVYALKPLVFFVPSSVISIFAGEHFGALFGFMLNILGCFLASTVGFYFARILGQSFVNKILRGKNIKLDDNIEKHGLKIMFTMRISMVFPHDALSYAAGLSKMKYRDFIVGTMFGMTPEMLIYSILGKSAERILSMKFLVRWVRKLGIYKYILLAAILIIVIILVCFYRKKNKNKIASEDIASDEDK